MTRELDRLEQLYITHENSIREKDAQRGALLNWLDVLHDCYAVLTSAQAQKRADTLAELGELVYWLHTACEDSRKLRVELGLTKDEADTFYLTNRANA